MGEFRRQQLLFWKDRLLLSMSLKWSILARGRAVGCAKLLLNSSRSNEETTGLSASSDLAGAFVFHRPRFSRAYGFNRLRGCHESLPKSGRIRCGSEVLPNPVTWNLQYLREFPDFGRLVRLCFGSGLCSRLARRVGAFSRIFLCRMPWHAVSMTVCKHQTSP